MSEQPPSNLCDTMGHDFQPKRQIALKDGADISELYCRRCGVVCMLGSSAASGANNLIRRV